MGYPISNFTTDKPGINSHADCVEGMMVNSEVAINNSSNLQDFIKFNNQGCIFSITLTGSPGIYDYVLTVDGQGPSGLTSGSGYLRFTDKTGDKYHLSLYSSTRSAHTLRYNSKQPEIVKIEWSNTRF